MSAGFAGNGSGSSFTIEGGVGSVSWTMAEIVDCAAGLARSAQLMDPLLDRLRNERMWLAQAGAGSTGIHAGVVEAMVLAEWRCGAVQGSLTQLAQNAGQAAANYAATEARAAASTLALSRLVALQDGWLTWTTGPLAPLKSAVDFSRWLEQVRDEGIRNATEQALRNGGAYAAGALGPGVALIYFLQALRPRDASGVGSSSPFVLRKMLDHAKLTRPGTLSVRAVPPGEWGGPPGAPPGNLDATFQSMLAGSRDAYGYPPGSIAVVQVRRPDGSNAWVVHLPGTEDWSTLDSTNPFDMEGNLEALTASQQARFRQQEVIVQELIKAALQAAGALPGEEVLLTGHSGGGIHAAAAAASPAFLEEVNVRMVIMAGAPAGNAQVPADIAVLGLENEHDVVTAADFHAPQPHKHWVTATSHRPPAAGGPLELLEQAHSMENYLDDADALDHSDDPAVRDAKRTLENLLGVGAGGAAIVGGKWVFQGRDNPPPPQQAGRGRPAPIRGKDYVPGSR